MIRSGMTLLELMVALTVTGIAMAAGYATFASMVDHRQRAADAVDEVVKAAAVRRTITTWLRGARLTVEEIGPQFVGVDGSTDDLADDEIAFLTTARTSNDSEESLVRLFIDRNERTPERGLVAEIAPWPARGRSMLLVIDSGVAGMELRYTSDVLGNRQWLPSWISSTVLPAGVEVSLLAAAGDTLQPLLRIPLLVPLWGGR